jgi:hypothetical protein
VFLGAKKGGEKGGFTSLDNIETTQGVLKMP